MEDRLHQLATSTSGLKNGIAGNNSMVRLPSSKLNNRSLLSCWSCCYGYKIFMYFLALKVLQCNLRG